MGQRIIAQISAAVVLGKTILFLSHSVVFGFVFITGLSILIPKGKWKFERNLSDFKLRGSN